MSIQAKKSAVLSRVLASTLGLSLVLAMTLSMSGCDPVPRRTLSLEEKTADLYWVYSQFNEYYAPMEYKANRFGFDYSELKRSYLARAEATQSNDEFYTLLHSFVAEFKDAHTSGALTNSDLPDRAKVAYLGFSGKRVGNALVVTELLPTIARVVGSQYPVKVGAKITKLNGRALSEIILAESVKTRNLGSDEANLTFHMAKLFNRMSTSGGIPSEANATLTVVEGTTEKEVILPWIVKDLAQFQDEQQRANPTAESTSALSILNMLEGSNIIARLGLLDFNDQMITVEQVRNTLLGWGDSAFDVTKSFRFVDDVATWRSVVTEGPQAIAAPPVPPTPAERTRAVRYVPPSALFIPEAVVYPAYISREKTVNAAGEETANYKLVGTILLHSFSVGGADSVILEQLNATIRAFQTVGVKDVVIDMINNGGGSLILGMKLAQALSKTKVVQPDIQFKLSDNWIDEFQSSALSRAESDADRELNRRVYEQLIRDRTEGKRLSTAMSIETLLNFGASPNPVVESNFNIVLVVNEMCASMCDIFAATMQDNGLAKVVGTQSMGAGGNVVNHDQAPNSHFSVRQTESLILRKDGSYIENNGVTPDVAFKVTDSAATKYDGARREALKVLLRE